MEYWELFYSNIILEHWKKGRLKDSWIKQGTTNMGRDDKEVGLMKHGMRG